MNICLSLCLPVTVSALPCQAANSSVKIMQYFILKSIPRPICLTNRIELSSVRSVSSERRNVIGRSLSAGRRIVNIHVYLYLLFFYLEISALNALPPETPGCLSLLYN